MSPYKNFLGAAKDYMNSHGFLRFLLSAHIAVFALGGLFYLLGIFLINIASAGGVSLYDAFVTLGTVLMWAGLLLSLIAEDPVTIVIASGSVAFCSLVAWIVLLARRFPFFFGPLFYFLVFGIICIITFIKAERFVKMRAEAAAKAAVHCTHCGYAMPKGATFCPMCGAPNAAMQYAPPVQPPYAAQPQYAPPAQPYAPPVQPPYAPPAQSYPPPAQPAAPAAEPAAEPAAPTEPVTPTEPAAPAEEDKKKCFSCGAELPAGAVYCGKCGMKQ